ncbi:MAG: KamA family radical SAM protein [Pirellulales bacterium]|nr:KamA family radical SAM protein [Pirellulales bacterium]
MASCILNDGSRNTLPCRTDWQSALDESVRDTAELCRLLDLDPTLGVEAATATGQWPLLVPRPYLSRIRRGDPADPLLLQVLPRAAELATVPGYSADPLGEAHARCGPGLLRKYQGRVLMVTTGACAVHCRFCFRRHFSFNSEPVGGAEDVLPPPAPPHCNGGAFRDTGYFPEDAQADNIDSVLRTVAADRSIHEIILSGGDPLMLSDRELTGLIERLAEIHHLRRLRIHARLPVMIPRRVTDELIDSIRGTRLSTIMVVHVNHPAEIDEEVARAFGRLIDSGVPLLSQSVLLRGVNDRADVLAELCERLADLRVIPYYLHQLDPVAGAAHFEVPETAGAALVTELRARLPGYAVPRYVRETQGGTNKEILA